MSTGGQHCFVLHRPTWPIACSFVPSASLHWVGKLCLAETAFLDCDCLVLFCRPVPIAGMALMGVRLVNQVSYCTQARLLLSLVTVSCLQSGRYWCWRLCRSRLQEAALLTLLVSFKLHVDHSACRHFILQCLAQHVAQEAVKQPASRQHSVTMNIPDWLTVASCAAAFQASTWFCMLCMYVAFYLVLFSSSATVLNSICSWC